MDKLRIIHIAPYLPYDLRIKILNHECDYVGIEYASANGFYFLADMLHVTYDGGSTGKDISTFKIILKPMSDLDSDDDCWGGNWRIDHAITTNDILSLPYDVVTLMIKNKYDVFGLIPSGLAIDINTLEMEVENGRT